MIRVVILVALVTILAGGGGAGGWFLLNEAKAQENKAAEEKPDEEPVEVDLDSEIAYELDPFVVPILREGRVIQHLTLILKIEFTTPVVRDHIKEIMPRLRDSLLTELHGVLAFRHVNEHEEILPVVRERLARAGNEVFGPGQVNAVLVVGMSRRIPDEG